MLATAACPNTIFMTEAVDWSLAAGKRVFGAGFDQKLRCGEATAPGEAEDILISAQFVMLLEHYLSTQLNSKNIESVIQSDRARLCFLPGDI